MLQNYLKITWKVLMRNKLFTFISLFGISLTLTILMTGTAFYELILHPDYPASPQNRMLYINRIDLKTKDGNNRYIGEPAYAFLDRYVRTLKSPQAVSIYSSGFKKLNYFRGSRKFDLAVKYTDAEFWQLLRFKFVGGCKNSTGCGFTRRLINYCFSSEICVLLSGKSNPPLFPP